jgi:hypothetical protein
MRWCMQGHGERSGMCRCELEVLGEGHACIPGAGGECRLTQAAHLLK